MKYLNNTLTNVPKIKEIKDYDEKLYSDNYKQIIKKYVNLALKDYFDETEIEEKLSKIETINFSNEKDSLSYERNMLTLDKSFLNVDINNLEKSLNKYPDLKVILTSDVIYNIFTNSNDSFEDRLLKKSVAIHLASDSLSNYLKEITFAGMTYNSYATVNAAKENVIRQLSIIFGKDKMVDILKNGYSSFLEMIDKGTNKKELVNEFLMYFSNIHEERNNFIEATYKKFLPGYTLIEDKLYQIEKILKGFNVLTQRDAINAVEYYNYDLSLLSKYFLTYEIKELTQDEKEYIKYIVELFDNNWINGNYLNNKFPKVKYSNGKYDTNQITFVNKYLTVMQSYYDEMDCSAINFKENFEKIQKLIIFEILPRYIRKNKNRNLNIEEIIRLGNFKTNNNEFDLNNSLRKKIIYKTLSKRLK